MNFPFSQDVAVLLDVDCVESIVPNVISVQLESQKIAEIQEVHVPTCTCIELFMYNVQCTMYVCIEAIKLYMYMYLCIELSMIPCTCKCTVGHCILYLW